MPLDPQEIENFIDAINEEVSSLPRTLANTSEEEQKFFGKTDIENLKNLKQNRRERKKYSEMIFTIVVIWVTLTLILFIAIGKGSLKYADNVIITLLTTTTANVIALFVLVAKYLFNPEKST